MKASGGMSLPPAPTVPLDQVEWRVDSEPNNDRCRFVPYMDARCVADLLDAWVGPENWWDTYEPGVVASQQIMWCHLTICHDGREITKTDIGKVPGFEAGKGAVSDAFKRAACVKWGVGRNVYELPTLWAPCKTTTRNGKVTAWPNDRTIPDLLEQLKKLGYDVKDGTRAATENHVDGVTSDPEPERLPDEDRLNLVAALKADPPEVQAAAKEWLAERQLVLSRPGITVDQANELEAVLAAVTPGGAQQELVDA